MFIFFSRRIFVLKKMLCHCTFRLVKKPASILQSFQARTKYQSQLKSQAATKSNYLVLAFQKNFDMSI